MLLSNSWSDDQAAPGASVNDGVINVQRATAADRELHELFMRKDDKEEAKKKC